MNKFPSMFSFSDLFIKNLTSEQLVNKRLSAFNIPLNKIKTKVRLQKRYKTRLHKFQSND